MGGNIFSDEELNNTLLLIVNLLNKHSITNWFLGYGTLLGIVRNNSCIDKDDDVDIVIDVKERDKVGKILHDNNYKFIYERPMFIKVEFEEEKPTVDFYFSHVNNDGDFHDTWEQVVWSKTTPFIEKEWNDVTLFLPNNYETKLNNRYGDDWETPKKSKGRNPRRNIL